MNLPRVSVAGPLLPWLLSLKQMSRTRVKELLRDGRITVNGEVTTRHDHPLRVGDTVALAPKSAVFRGASVGIVHEDDHLIVIEKPTGLLSVASDTSKDDTAFTRLNEQLAARRAGRAFVVHRLDRETSGLLLFARSASVRDTLQEAWASVEKGYFAIVEGSIEPSEGVLDTFLAEGRDLRVRSVAPDADGAQRAVTRYRVLGSRDGLSLVEVGLETGRKHQIRVQLCDAGCPVIGDPLYGQASDPVNRLGLHACRLTFAHPVTGERVEVASPLPKRFRRLVPEGF